MIEKIGCSSRIRLMTIDDLERVLCWRNSLDVRRFMFTQHEITLDEHIRWFNKVSKDPDKHLLIFEKDGVSQGFVNINELGGQVADWGFYTAPDSPKGTGFQLGQAALSYAFDILELHKVCGQALEFNERSVRFHLRIGFQQEGRLREHYYDGHEYHAVICFGLLRHEWQRNNEV